MPSHVDAYEIALRLACALLAGGLLGLNREVKSHPAGLRTLVLVCLAAALVMIEANLLLSTRLPTGGGFATFDVLRLPLGLLSGVGMLGAGAIIHRTEAVRGVTTAASLWYATAVGLCIGAGLIVLGLTATGLGLLVLWGLRLAEHHLPHRARARLTISADGRLSEDELQARLGAGGFQIASFQMTYDGPGHYTLEALVHSVDRRGGASQPPLLFTELARTPGVTKAVWNTDV
jgi:putative Mg2+ transporter-C (MgtC) family protein